MTFGPGWLTLPHICPSPARGSGSIPEGEICSFGEQLATSRVQRTLIDGKCFADHLNIITSSATGSIEIKEKHCPYVAFVLSQYPAWCL